MARGYTCHLDIVDRWGSMFLQRPALVAIVAHHSVCLGNRAQMFTLEAVTPSMLGPKRRPRTTLSLVLVLPDGRPWLAFGMPGGDQQDRWALHLLLPHLHHVLNFQEAIEAPGFHTAYFPGSFYPLERHPAHMAVEVRVALHDQAELRRRGHRLEVGEDWSIGRMTADAKEGEMLKAGANPRFMQGYAIGR